MIRPNGRRLRDEQIQLDLSLAEPSRRRGKRWTLEEQTSSFSTAVVAVGPVCCCCLCCCCCLRCLLFFLLLCCLCLCLRCCCAGSVRLTQNPIGNQTKSNQIKSRAQFTSCSLRQSRLSLLLGGSPAYFHVSAAARASSGWACRVEHAHTLAHTYTHRGAVRGRMRKRN